MKTFLQAVLAMVLVMVLLAVGAYFFAPKTREYQPESAADHSTYVVHARSQEDLHARIAQLRLKGWEVWETREEEGLSVYRYKALLISGGIP